MPIAQYTPPTPTRLNCRVESRRRCVQNSQLVHEYNIGQYLTKLCVKHLGFTLFAHRVYSNLIFKYVGLNEAGRSALAYRAEGDAVHHFAEDGPPCSYRSFVIYLSYISHLFCGMDSVGDLRCRWRRDVDKAASRSDAALYQANVWSTHATTGPPTVTTSSSAVSPSTHLLDVHDRPLAVEPVGRKLPGEMRRNPLKDVGAFITTYHQYV